MSETATEQRHSTIPPESVGPSEAHERMEEQLRLMTSRLGSIEAIAEQMGALTCAGVELGLLLSKHPDDERDEMLALLHGLIGKTSIIAMKAGHVGFTAETLGEMAVERAQHKSFTDRLLELAPQLLPLLLEHATSMHERAHEETVDETFPGVHPYNCGMHVSAGVVPVGFRKADPATLIAAALIAGGQPITRSLLTEIEQKGGIPAAHIEAEVVQLGHSVIEDGDVSPEATPQAT